MGAAMARRGPVVFIARPARAGAVWGHRPGSRALAAGVTWTSRTSSAPWAARDSHTSVVDAAGAIYVIGGFDGRTELNDVWVTTDGGARAGLGRWGWSGGTVGFSGATRWYHGVLQGYSVY